ncbi:MAG: hypothetical protein Q7T82_00130 [Armatimonadota bacterium]|nr:hypothetical protein [Armatimonadota bacterium]
MTRFFRLTYAVCAMTFALTGPSFAQTAVLRGAPEIKFPAGVDSNNPAHWDGDTFYIFNSGERTPVRGEGKDQFSLANPVKTEYNNQINGKRWIECTWRADGGILYGWYHNEPGGLCPGKHLTAPRIGAVRSKDNGAHWEDLGIVLEACPTTIDCDYKNGYFGGGNGDFSCMLGHDKKYLYLFISTYAGDVSVQGVAVARMAWKDRDNPVGKVRKYYNGKWEEPGVGGKLTPIFPGKISWKEENADQFWGPSVHWNTHLKKYVMLLNHTCCKPGWPQEGIYISYSDSLSKPKSWTEPKRIMEGGWWYPQVVGVNSAAKETDKLCGRQARFYFGGVSRREIIFFRDGEDSSKLPEVYGAGK